MRITVDLDYPSELQKLKTYLRMKNMGIVEVCESSGGNGFHMIISGLNLTLQEVIELRRWLGDDTGRIYFDELGYQFKPKQVLFTKKDKKHIQWLDEGNILALPFFSRIKSKKIEGV